MNDIQAMLTELASMDRRALASRWSATFGVPAPKSCQSMLLRQALAWNAQMRARQQAVGAREASRPQLMLRRAAISPQASALTPGVRLLREWQGRTHHVTVVEGGFDYEGRVWRSLSAIARQITGTRWSGPVFFGLNK